MELSTLDADGMRGFVKNLRLLILPSPLPGSRFSVSPEMEMYRMRGLEEGSPSSAFQSVGFCPEASGVGFESRRRIGMILRCRRCLRRSKRICVCDGWFRLQNFVNMLLMEV